MIDLLTEGLLLFTNETGITQEFAVLNEYIPWAILTVAVMACLFGFKIYRAVLSVLLFLGIAFSFSYFLKGKTDWGTIVTLFSTIGMLISFISLYWNRSGGCIICALIAGTLSWLIIPNIWLSVFFGILAIVCVLNFPVISIELFTSAWGTITFMSAAHVLELPIAILGIVLGIIGFVLQFKLNKNQKVFKKTCPDSILQKMEQRKRVKHANSIS